MKVKILSWNVRGLNEADKRTTTSSLIKKWKPNIVCLQETKIEEFPVSWIRQIWGNHWVEWAELKSVGNGGGIIIL